MVKMTSGIYAIFNLSTEKFYVGQASIISKRIRNHKIELRLFRHVNIYLQAAWCKYGEADFILFTLENVEAERLTDREQWWMDQLKSADREHGYNMAPAAGSLIGYKATEATKAKLRERSAKLKGIPRTAEVRAKIGAAHKGRVFSEETREKMRIARLGKKQSEEFKDARRQALLGNKYNTGRKQSAEEIEVRRKANTGKKRTIEQREAMSERQIGRILSAETRERMRISALNRKDRLTNRAD